MANKKNFYYVLVMTSTGPVFVTNILSGHRAKWEKDKVPMEFGTKSYAEDVTFGLNLNFHTAFMVVQPFEISSQPYLYKIFTDKASKSPKEFILSEKLDYAKSLLTETDISITHIAYSIGFQDVLMFSKFFKLKAGISPTEYRSQHVSAKYKTFT